METFTPISALAGGVILGLASLLLLLANGRISGISGITSALFTKGLHGWRWLFLSGLILGSWLATELGAPMPQMSEKPDWLLAIAGLLVGLGTSIGSGCTSGHGVCGLGRLSGRSLIATCVFMFIAMLMVWLVGV